MQLYRADRWASTPLLRPSAAVYDAGGQQLTCHCPTKSFMKLDFIRLKTSLPSSGASCTLRRVLKVPLNTKNSHRHTCMTWPLQDCQPHRHGGARCKSSLLPHMPLTLEKSYLRLGTPSEMFYWMWQTWPPPNMAERLRQAPSVPHATSPVFRWACKSDRQQHDETCLQ